MPSRGSIVTAQGASPAWAELLLGTSGKTLVSDGTDVVWSATLKADSLVNAVNTALITLSGGNSTSAGANIELYGGAHSTYANKAYYDASAHTFRSQDAGTALFSHDGSNFYHSTGFVAISDAVTPDTAYKGLLIITRATTAAQYINMIRSGTSVWSIGMKYGTSDFAIGGGQSTDSNFTSPAFRINASNEVFLASKLYVNGSATYYLTYDSGNTRHETNANFLSGGYVYASSDVYLVNELRMYQKTGYPANGGSTWIYGNYYYESGQHNDIFFNFNGSLYIVTMSAHSDKKYKSNIADMGGVLAGIMQLKPSTYHFKDNRWDRDELGLIAEDVEPVFPLLIKKLKMGKDQDGKETYDRLMDYERLSVIAIQGIREQQTIIDDLLTRLDKLENKNG